MNESRQKEGIFESFGYIMGVLVGGLRFVFCGKQETGALLAITGGLLVLASSFIPEHNSPFLTQYIGTTFCSFGLFGWIFGSVKKS